MPSNEIFGDCSAVRNGHIKRITDPDIASSVLEIQSANVSTTYISCPADQAKTLGIKLPFLILIVKNLKKYFTFEVQVLDDKNVRRRFRASNYQVKLSRCSSRLSESSSWRSISMQDECDSLQLPMLAHSMPSSYIRMSLLTGCCSAQSATRVKPFICTMPMRLDEGWNQIQFNLAEFTRRAYGELCYLKQIGDSWEGSGMLVRSSNAI